LMREKLKQDELAVMQLRWGISVNGDALEDPLSLDETARRMGKTKDQIRLIENRAWKSLKVGQDFNKLKSLLGAGENDSE
jgi:DNA-directed RNA polymerase sigma subunit (sigma70/sigma32)